MSNRVLSKWVDEDGIPHFYECINKTETWMGAYNASKASTYNGLTGYLATISSQDEQNFIYNSIAKTTGWSGGTRAVFTDGTRINDEISISDTIAGYITNPNNSATANYYWADGPEAGTEFYKGPRWDSPGAGQIPGVYSTWGSGQPDASNYTTTPALPGTFMEYEAFVQFAYNGLSTWNDNSWYNPNYIECYYIEYSPYGGQLYNPVNEYSADVPQPIVIKHETAAGLTVAATSYRWGDIGVAYSQATYKYPSDLLTGYTFVQVNGTEPTGITNKVVELTYIYQLESYVLSFEANSGTLTAYSGATSQTLDYGTSTGAALTDPVRAGYAFTG